MIMKHLSGFTLIELAIILVIVGLLAGGLLLPLTTQLDIAKFQETNKILNQVRESLINYALLNNYLPCPATDQETGSAISPPCNIEGFLPWANLGIGRYDAWGQPIRYRVDANYVSHIPNPPVTTNQLAVRDADGSDLVTSHVVAIIFSYGKNGHLADSSVKTWGDVLFPRAFAEPSTTKIYYTQGTFTQKDSDDTVVWLTQDSLVGRLVIAGKLQIKPEITTGTTPSPCRERSCFQ